MFCRIKALQRRLALHVLLLSLLVKTCLCAYNPSCKAPASDDPIIAFSELLGRPNPADAVWHDDMWAFRQHGPISRLTAYKAWFYDGVWHEPGELKGLQTWFGPEQYAGHDNDTLLGARRPHVPKTCWFHPGEAIIAAEVQWDHIMRWVNFTSNMGRLCAWGFPNVANATSAVVTAPTRYSYLAAFRGYEGKPLPRSLGGFKKRYIIQLGWAWAEQDCGQQRMPNLVTRQPHKTTVATEAAAVADENPDVAAGPLQPADASSSRGDLFAAEPAQPTAPAAAAAWLPAAGPSVPGLAATDIDCSNNSVVSNQTTTITTNSSSNSIPAPNAATTAPSSQPSSRDTASTSSIVPVEPLPLFGARAAAGGALAPNSTSPGCVLPGKGAAPCNTAGHAGSGCAWALWLLSLLALCMHANAR